MAGRPTRAEISLANIRFNFDQVQRLVGPEVARGAVVKADAYGHGAVEVARALAGAGAAWLCVALPEEGVQLREAGLDLPILCLGGFWGEQAGLVLDHDLTPELYRTDLCERLDVEAARRGAKARIHVKVDTGMGRLGVPAGELPRFLDAIARLRHLEVDGLMTHLASADVPALAEFTKRQVERFYDALGLLERRGIEPRWRHLANGAGLHAYPEARGNLVRPGAMLYGLKADVLNPEGPEVELRPGMKLVSSVEQLKTVPAGTPLGYGCTYVTERESVIATLPAGYADGVRRALSSAGEVTVRGRRAPIVGRVSMDLTMVDVTGVEGVALEDDVVFFGDGDITAEEVAGVAGTISYEICCGVSARVPRVYVD